MTEPKKAKINWIEVWVNGAVLVMLVGVLWLIAMDIKDTSTRNQRITVLKANCTVTTSYTASADHIYVCPDNLVIDEEDK